MPTALVCLILSNRNRDENVQKFEHGRSFKLNQSFNRQTMDQVLKNVQKKKKKRFTVPRRRLAVPLPPPPSLAVLNASIAQLYGNPSPPKKKKTKKAPKKKPKQRKRKLRVANVVKLPIILVLPMVPIK